MPTRVSAEKIEALCNVIGRYADGIAIGELMKLDELSFSLRTLQRRLEALVASGRVESEGKGRAQKYRLPRESPDERISEVNHEENPEVLSTGAIEVRELVKRPVYQRNPAGYRREFLAAYEPNRSAYLSAQLRAELAALGQVGLSDLPAGTYLRQVLDRLLIDLSWNSSRLEGNTYSLLETQRLLQFGEWAEGRGALEAQMLLNHKAAIEMLADQATEIGFNRYTICNLHALLSDNLLADPAACGSLRSRPVGIGGTVYHPLEVPQQIEERFDEILTKATAIVDPFEQAFFVMVHLPYLQPFEDVNKRVSRLAANIPLIRHNLCPLSFIDVEQEDYVGGLIGVYELNRVEYLRDVFVWAYRRSCLRYTAVRQSLGEPDPFRLRYRLAIGELVRAVVTGNMNRSQAEQAIKRSAGKLPKPDEVQFCHTVQTELACLHVGNIARFRLLPSQYHGWKAAQDAGAY